MLLKIVITLCALAGAFALMAAFWTGAFQPIKMGWAVPYTTYSPAWAHVVLMGLLLGCMKLKVK